VLAFGGAAAAPVAARALPPAWCGSRGSSDLICATTGRVALTPPGAPLASVFGDRRPRRVAPETAIHVGPGAYARATFARQALCTLGAASSPTEIVTRWEGADHMYRQDHGQSLCSFSRLHVSSLPFFCRDLRCPVIVRTDGSAAAIHTSNPVIITLCTGAIVIRVDNGDGLAEYEESSSEIGRVRIEITQTDDSIDLRVDSLAAPGVCANRVFAQQRRALSTAG
jgi:hypothetical protein